MTQVVRVERDQHVVIVSLSRPGKFNALNLETFQALIDTGKRLAADNTVRAVVLSREGEPRAGGSGGGHFVYSFVPFPFIGGYWTSTPMHRPVSLPDANQKQSPVQEWHSFLQPPVPSARSGAGVSIPGSGNGPSGTTIPISTGEQQPEDPLRRA